LRTFSERLLRTVSDAWLGGTAYGVFAASGHSVVRWSVVGTYEERARWCALLKRGISVQDLLFLEPRWRRHDMRLLLRNWLRNGWLDRTIVPIAPAPMSARGGTLVLGESPTLRRMFAGAVHAPRQTGGSAWLRRWLTAIGPSLVVYDAQAMQWAGLSALYRQVVGRIDLLALFRVGSSFALVALPAGSDTCLGCAERWLVGSSKFPCEMGAWLRGLISEAAGLAEPLPIAVERELFDLATALRLGTLGGAYVAVARGSEPPDRMRIHPHPSCPARHRPRAAVAAAMSSGGNVLERCMVNLAGPVGLFQGLHVENIADTATAPYYFAAAAFNTGFATRYVDPIHCFGDADDEALASLRCVAECIERFCTFHFDAGSLIRGSYAELRDHAIAPPDLTLYSDAQYRANGFPFQRFDPRRTLEWVRARALATGREVLVPAEFVFAGYVAATALTRETTAGVATRETFDDAACAALLEGIERDALAISFLAGHAPPRLAIPADSDLGEKARVMGEAGFEVAALDLQLDLDVAVVLMLALRPGGPAPLFLKGAGASLRRDKALAQAMREVWRSFLYYRRHQEAANFARAAHPWSMEYGLAYYQRPEALESLRFLLKGPPAIARQEAAEPDSLSRVVAAAARAQLEPIAVDCTLSMVRDVGLHCVRVLVPGLQPISVGEAPPRLGGRRVFELPQRLKWRHELLTEATLHRAPHFFT
jgi:ribosomal protein S12 methylthiotransferase accessory factor